MGSEIDTLNTISKTLTSKKDIEQLNKLINKAINLLMDDSMNAYTKSVQISNIINVALLLEKKAKLELDTIKIDNSKIVSNEVKPITLNLISSATTKQEERISRIEQEIEVVNGGSGKGNA